MCSSANACPTKPMPSSQRAWTLPTSTPVIGIITTITKPPGVSTQPALVAV